MFVAFPSHSFFFFICLVLKPGTSHDPFEKQGIFDNLGL